MAARQRKLPPEREALLLPKEQRKGITGVGSFDGEIIEANIPKILALKKVGASIRQIAELIGVKESALIGYCQSFYDLQDVCATLEYRKEFCLAQLVQDFAKGLLSEKGKFKLIYLLEKLELSSLKKKLAELDVRIKEIEARNLEEGKEARQLLEITLNGITTQEIDEAMKSMSIHDAYQDRIVGKSGKIVNRTQSDYENEYRLVKGSFAHI